MPAPSIPRERETGRAAQPAQVGERVREWMGPVDVGVAVGRDDEHGRGRVGLQDVEQELEAGAVGPVEVVEHEEHGRLGRRGADDPGHGLEEEEPFGLGIRHRGRRE